MSSLLDTLTSYVHDFKCKSLIFLLMDAPQVRTLEKKYFFFKKKKILFKKNASLDYHQ
jgi:hypothetical protein